MRISDWSSDVCSSYLVFNPAPARTPQKQPNKRSYKGPHKGKLSGHPQGAWPSNVWNIPNIGHNHPERTGHPAQFPLELARRAVQLYTNPGDLVIDPFSGSGTTHVACIETHRSFRSEEPTSELQSLMRISYA